MQGVYGKNPRLFEDVFGAVSRDKEIVESFPDGSEVKYRSLTSCETCLDDNCSIGGAHFNEESAFPGYEYQHPSGLNGYNGEWDDWVLRRDFSTDEYWRGDEAEKQAMDDYWAEQRRRREEDEYVDESGCPEESQVAQCSFCKTREEGHRYGVVAYQKRSNIEVLARARKKKKKGKKNG